MYTEREPYLATPGIDSCWQTWHNSTVQRLHHRQTCSHGAEGWKNASEDNKWMIVQCECAAFNDKSVSDIRFRIQFPFGSSFWISLSDCKLTILLDIQPANRIVIISGVCGPVVFAHFRRFGQRDLSLPYAWKALLSVTLLDLSLPYAWKALLSVTLLGLSFLVALA